MNGTTNVTPVCPYCKKQAGLGMRADVVPDVPSAGLITFCCANCSCILGIAWAPPEIVAKLGKQIVQ